MCQFGDQSKIISEQVISKEAALVGYRNWYITNSFSDKEKFLKSTSMDFLWPKKEIVKGNPSIDNSEGIYSYNYYYKNYYYNNHYYNNNHNYYDYNYYNHYKNYNYNNYDNYYNNYYNYYYNYNYNICGKILNFGKIFSYKEGYRSEFAIPTHLVILSDKRWFEDNKTKNFASHFNEIAANLANEYDCEVIGYDEFIYSVLEP